MAINYKALRLLRRSWNNEPVKPSRMPFLWLLMAFLALLVLFSSCRVCHADITDTQAINACIGEAEGETYLGKVMLLYTLHNRGSIKGVYGVTADRVVKHKYAQVTYDQCAKAWKFVKNNTNHGWRATGWGNKADLKIFKRSKWFKNCVVVAKVGGHFFYVERGR